MARKSTLGSYRAQTRQETLEQILLPVVCKVLGHPREQKMHAVICRRCRIVLEQR